MGAYLEFCANLGHKDGQSPQHVGPDLNHEYCVIDGFIRTIAEWSEYYALLDAVGGLTQNCVYSSVTK